MPPACHYAICQQFTIWPNAQRNNVCAFSPPPSPAIQLPPWHRERQFPVWAQLMKFRSEEQASNWISTLLLKVQLSMAELGRSGVWILVSWCKQGTLATYASHQHRIVRCVFSKEPSEEAPRSLLTHMCGQMQACCDMNASCFTQHIFV